MTSILSLGVQKHRWDDGINIGTCKTCNVIRRAIYRVAKRGNAKVKAVEYSKDGGIFWTERMSPCPVCYDIRALLRILEERKGTGNG